MILRRLYYTVKPLIPRPLQIALRRRVALRKLKSLRDIWPIDPEAGKAPQGWKGWPGQKKFAIVLSHDVDTARGRDRCLQLMELEKELGFRSSLNFVPEGYEVRNDVLRTVRESGFEIGVHGLVHDEKHFTSRRTFERRAPRINHYLKEWDAKGFHSPAMIRNLDWIGELDIEYDCSTFDTDPFEPQPDGVGTIFPFIVYGNSGQPLRTADRRRQTADSRIHQTRASRIQNPAPGRSSHELSSPISEVYPPLAAPKATRALTSASSPPSLLASQHRGYYVELPYTLPQDHCLFVILKEKDIRIWKEKLDWIVEKGGMALLNSHPDYMNFEKRECRFEEYDVSMYRAFLQYTKSKYEGQYWHALPREIAKFVKRAMVRESQCGETGGIFAGPAELQQEESKQ